VIGGEGGGDGDLGERSPCGIHIWDVWIFGSLKENPIAKSRLSSCKDATAMPSPRCD